MADNIQVAIKVRPLIKKEKVANLSSLWTINNNCIYPTDSPEQQYNFDHIFGTEDSNSEVFEKIARPIVEKAVEGINGTLFAYGQTASGKTYTMMGTKEEPGVIPLSIFYIFQKIENVTGRQFLLRVSYLELYNEKLRDLLINNGDDIKIREDFNGLVIRCREEVTNCPKQMLDLMITGNKNRRVGETNMNERSSRSHTIFRIIIESNSLEDKDSGQVQVAQLNLVDLAGSERANQTAATGARLKEGCHINKSLLALSMVIKYLSDGTDSKTFINFRDSKLTRLLQNSLGGNAMTGIICAITPVALDETHSTLHFASTAKKIKNKPRVNEVISENTLLKRMEKQISKLNDDLEKAKSTATTSDALNQFLMERIKRLEETILSSGSSINNAHPETKKKKSHRRRTWAPGCSITEFSVPSTSDTTPFEDFELDLFNDLPDKELLHPSNSKFPRKTQTRFSTLSDISEGDYRTSLDSCLQIDVEGPNEVEEIVSPITTNICCTAEELLDDSFRPSLHDTPCRLKRLLLSKDQELNDIQETLEFHHQEVINMRQEIDEYKNSLQLLNIEKETMANTLNLEITSLKKKMESQSEDFKLLNSDLQCQIEYKDNKYQLREQELLTLLKELDNDKKLHLTQIENTESVLQQRQTENDELQKKIIAYEASLEEEKRSNNLLKAKLIEKDTLTLKQNQDIIDEFQNKLNKVEVSLQQEIDTNALLKRDITEKDAIVTQIQDISATLEQKEKEIEELQINIIKFEALLEEEKNSNVLLKNIIAEKDATIAQVQDRSSFSSQDYQNKIEQLQQQIIELESLLNKESDTNAFLKNRITEKDVLLTQMQESISVLDQKQKEIDQYQEDINEFKNLLQNERSNNTALMNDMMQKEGLLKQLEASMSTKQKEIEELQEEVAKIEHSLQNERESNAFLKADLTEKNARLASLEQQRDNAVSVNMVEQQQRDIEELKEKMSKYEISLQKEKEDNAVLKKIIAEKDIIVQQSKETISTLEQDQKKLQETVINLEASHPTVTAENKISIVPKRELCEEFEKPLKKEIDSRLVNNEQMNKFKDCSLVADLESLISVAKIKYQEIDVLLDDFHRSENNTLNLQEKVREMQLLNKKCQTGCEKLREELELCLIDKSLYRRASAFAENLKTNDEHFNNLRVGLENLQSTNNVNVQENKNMGEIFRENVKLREKVHSYKSVIIIAQNDLQMFRSLLMDLKMELEFNVGNTSALSVANGFGCNSESTLDPNYLLAENTIGSILDSTMTDDYTKILVDTLHYQSTPKGRISNVFSASSLSDGKTTPIEKENPGLPPISKKDDALSLKSELQKLEEKYSEIQNTVGKLQSKNSELESDLTNFKQRNNELLCEIRALNENIEEQQVSLAEFDDLKLLNAELETDISKLTQTIAQLNIELKLSKEENIDLESKILSDIKGKDSNEIEVFKLNIEHQNMKILELNSLLKTMEDKNENLEIDIKNINQTHDNIIAEKMELIQELEMKIQSALKDQSNYIEDIKTLKYDIQDLQKHKEMLEDKLMEKQAAYDKLLYERDIIFSEKLDAQNALEDATLGFSSKTIKELSVESELADLCEQIESSKRIIEEKEYQIETLNSDNIELKKQLQILNEDYEKLKNQVSFSVNLEEYNVMAQAKFLLETKIKDLQKSKEQETLELQNEIIKLKADLAQFEASHSDIRSETDVIRQKMYNEIKALAKDGVDSIETMSLVDLYNLIIKCVMERQIYICEEMDNKHKKSQKNLNQEIMNLTTELKNLKTKKETVESDLCAALLDNKNLKEQIENNIMKSKDRFEELEQEIITLTNGKLILEQEKEMLVQELETVKNKFKSCDESSKQDNDLCTKYSLLESEMQIQKNYAENLMKQYNDLKNAYEETKVKYDILCEDHEKQQTELKNQNDNLQKTFNEIESKYNMLMNQHNTCNQMTNEFSELSDKLRNSEEKCLKQISEFEEKLKLYENMEFSFEDVKSKYKALMDEHSSCNEKTIEFEVLSDKLKNSEEQCLKQKFEFEEKLKSYENMIKPFEEVRSKYKTLVEEHRSCNKISNEFEVLSSKLKSSEEKCLKQRSDFEEKLKYYENMEQSFDEVRSKYEILVEEHSSCCKKTNEFVELSSMLKSSEEKCLKQRSDFEEKLKYYENMEQSFDEVRSKYKTLIEEHGSCNKISNEFEVLSSKLKNAEEKFLKQKTEFADKLKYYENMEQSLEDVRSKYKTLIEEHRFCYKKTNEFAELSSKLKNSEAKYSKQRSEFEEKLKYYENMEQSFEDVRSKYKTLIEEHRFCYKKTNEFAELSSKLKNSEAKYSKQRSEFEEKLKYYENMEQSFDEVRSKYRTLIDEHSACNKMTNEFVELTSMLKNAEEKCLKQKSEFEALNRELQSENDKLHKKLNELEASTCQNDKNDHSRYEEKYKNAMQINKQLNNNIKTLHSKYAEFKNDYIRIKDKIFENETLMSENKAIKIKNSELTKELNNIKMEKENLAKELKEEMEKIKNFLDRKGEIIQAYVQTKPRMFKMPWIPQPDFHYNSFSEKLSNLIDESEKRKERLSGMDKLVAECDRLRSESKSMTSKLELLTETDFEKDKQLKELKGQLNALKADSKSYFDRKDDEIKSLCKELEGATNCATAANKKINELRNANTSLESEVLRVNENWSNKCESLLKQLKDLKTANENLQDRIVDLEIIKKENSEVKLRRRSTHDSSRNLADKIDMADKCSLTDPDHRLSELQQEVKTLNHAKQSLISEYKNQLQEKNKINMALQNKLQEKVMELNKMQSLLITKPNKCDTMEKNIQTDDIEENPNSDTFKEKYQRYRRLCQMRFNEIQSLKHQLEFNQQNKENAPA